MVDRADVKAIWIVRRVVKTAAAGVLLAAGAHRALRLIRRLQAPGPRVLLVSYHRATLDFSESAREALPAMLISAATLRRQLEQLGRTWEVVPLTEAARILAEGTRAPSRGFAAVTFDDGYSDNHSVALPVLSTLRMPATVYVASGFIGTSARLAHDRLYATLSELARRDTPPERAGLETPLQALLTACALGNPAATLDRLIATLPHPRLLALAAALEARTGITSADLPPSTRLLDWDELREMSASGVEVGGHSVSHAVLPNLPLAEARREIEGCRDAIADGVGRRPRHFAYPNGYHSPAVRRAVREAGFETGSTREDRDNVPGCDLFALRRRILWENSTLGPLGYSAVLAACSFEGVFSALRLSRAAPGERPDAPASSRVDAELVRTERAAS